MAGFTFTIKPTNLRTCAQCGRTIAANNERRWEADDGTIACPLHSIGTEFGDHRPSKYDGFLAIFGTEHGGQWFTDSMIPLYDGAE